MKPLLLGVPALLVIGSIPLVAQPGNLPDLPVIDGNSLGPNLNIALDTGSHAPMGMDVSPTGDSLVFTYSGGQICSPSPCMDNFALISNQASSSVDYSSYQALLVRLKGDTGSSVEIAVQDSAQTAGTQTTVLLRVSPDYQTYYIPLSWFLHANLKSLSYPAQLIFKGSQRQTLTVSKIAYTTQQPASGRLLPHVVFGGGWATSMEFANNSGAIISFPINFFASNGVPLDVPAGGNSSMAIGITVRLAPYATSIVDLPNSGAVTSGYAVALLPPDVTAFGILRQTVPGQADLEASVPFSSTTGTSTTLTFDETKYVTTVALVNPSLSDATISVFARDLSGNTLGGLSLFLPAKTKQTLVLRNLQGLGRIAMQRGSVQFVANSGNIAVTGLRSGTGSLTSILALIQ
jgi:hypothetical protein